jgi:CBS domain-containing protein
MITHRTSTAAKRTRRRAIRARTRVRDLMSRDLVTISPLTLAVHADRLAAGQSVHHLPVLDAGVLVGVVCRCDLWGTDADAVACEVMTTPPSTIDSLASMEEAADAMRELAVGCLPVLDGDTLVGILTRGDLRRAGLLDEETITRTCASCGGRHHVRPHEGRKLSFCLSCLERGASFDDTELDEDVGD